MVLQPKEHSLHPFAMLIRPTSLGYRSPAAAPLSGRLSISGFHTTLFLWVRKRDQCGELGPASSRRNLHLVGMKESLAMH